MKRLISITYIYYNKKDKLPVVGNEVFVAPLPVDVTNRMAQIIERFNRNKDLKKYKLMVPSFLIHPISPEVVLNTGELTPQRMVDLVRQFMYEYTATKKEGVFFKEEFLKFVREGFVRYFNDVMRDVRFENGKAVVQELPKPDMQIAPRIVKVNSNVIGRL